MQAVPRPLWRQPLILELGIILLLKLAVLMIIKTVWFDAPTFPEEGAHQVEKHLFDGTVPISRHRPEEESK